MIFCILFNLSLVSPDMFDEKDIFKLLFESIDPPVTTISSGSGLSLTFKITLFILFNALVGLKLGLSITSLGIWIS